MNPDHGKNSEPLQSEREHILKKLPLTVTSVTPQKKNSDRFSLFHDQIFLIGASSQTLLDCSIQKGSLLTRDLFHKIRLAEKYQTTKERAYLLLSGRDHGAEELRRKLVHKNFDPVMTEQVVDEFHQKGLLNDHTYAIHFARDKHNLNQWGPNKISSALHNKGVPASVIDTVLADLNEEINQKNVCIDLVLKRRKHFLRESDEYKRKQKIFRYLAGKGYSSDDIQRSIPTIIEQLDA